MSIQKDASVKQEFSVARNLGGSMIPSSGSSKFSAGDVKLGNFLIECKTVINSRLSFSIKEEWLKKIKDQAFEQGFSKSALVFRFDPEGKDYIVLDLDTFKDMYDSYIEVN